MFSPLSQTRRRPPAARRAFTLIELLVVIAIISILASILFPVFARVRVNAYKTGSLSNLKQLGIAYMLYMQDYDERTMSSDTFANRYPPKLMPYIKNWNLLRSPMQTGPRSATPGDYLDTLTPDYGYNTCYLGAAAGVAENPAACFSGPTPGTYALAGIADHTNTVLFVSSTFLDSATNRPSLGFHRVAPPSAWSGTMPVQWDSYGYNWPRYNGLFAVGFLDGHAKALNIRQLSDESIWDRN